MSRIAKTIEPLTISQIKEAPLSVLLMQKKIIPKHDHNLMNALDEAIQLIADKHSSNARERNLTQVFRQDGSPIVGALFRKVQSPTGRGKRYKNKAVVCHMPCCTVYHPPPKQTFMQSPVSKIPKIDESWIRVESRSERQKRQKRIARQRQQDDEGPIYEF
jgi:hypothetical protein